MVPYLVEREDKDVHSSSNIQSCSDECSKDQCMFNIITNSANEIHFNKLWLTSIKLTCRVTLILMMDRKFYNFVIVLGAITSLCKELTSRSL